MTSRQDIFAVGEVAGYSRHLISATGDGARVVAEGKAPPSLCASGGPSVNYRLQEITGTATVFRSGRFSLSFGPRWERRKGMAGRYRVPTKKNIFSFESLGGKPFFREQMYKEIGILKNRIRNLRSQLDRIESEIKEPAGDK
jgi:hypothetical protein